MSMQRRIADGERIPSGYAPAYRDWLSNHTVCYPVGVHWLVRAGRTVWWLGTIAQFGSRAWEAREREIYSVGYRAGLAGARAQYIDEGRAQGWKQLSDQAVKEWCDGWKPALERYGGRVCQYGYLGAMVIVQVPEQVVIAVGAHFDIVELPCSSSTG